MKKQLIIALAFSISAFSFAQKKELKTAEKAIKKADFTAAKTALKQAEGMMSSMDDEQKSFYHYLNAASLFANGKGEWGEVNRSFVSIDKINDKYHAVERNKLKDLMYNDFLKKANKSYEGKNFKAASFMFERAYKVQKRDTSYLYNAALLATSVPDYDRALELYEKLKELGYTGVEKQLIAINKATGKEDSFPNAQIRKISIKQGTHETPSTRVTKSKKPEIVKNIALIYISQGDNEKALAALKDARAENPDNVDLIINEANIYLKLENEDKFKELIQEAITKDPDNEVLHYNVGVVSMNKGDLEQAQKSYEKVLSLNPSYSDAALNLSNVFIGKGNVIVEEMGKLGMSKADDAKYEKFKVEKNALFQQGADILNTFIDKNPDAGSDIFTQLKNIYNALGETGKAKEIAAKIEALEGGQ